MDAVKVMAKSLVRSRQSVTKLYNLKSQLQAVSLKLQTLKSTQAMSDAMRGATKAMTMMNKKMNLPQMQKLLMEFERQNERMEMTSEMMNDVIDDTMGAENEDEETDELVSQVLDEIGINTDQQLLSAPMAKKSAQEAPAAAQPQAEAAGGIDEDLQARLDNLRKS